MKAKLSNYYRKPGGIMVFLYVVLGTAAELAAYKEAQGSNYRENEAHEPLFFSTRPLSTNRSELVPLTITSNNRIVADDLNKVLSQEAKLDDYILQERAKLLARQAVGMGGVDRLGDLTATRDVVSADAEADVIAASVNVGQEIPA